MEVSGIAFGFQMVSNIFLNATSEPLIVCGSAGRTFFRIKFSSNLVSLMS